MSKRDMQSFWGGVGDILREASWPMRLGVLLGFALGLLVCYFIVTSDTVVETGRVLWRFVLLLCVIIFLVGGFLGVGLGALLDSLFSPKDEKPEKKRRRKRKYRLGRVDGE